MKENQLLRDLNIVVLVTDQRRIEVIANGLPFWCGKQLAIDTTVVSALSGRGVARGRTAKPSTRLRTTSAGDTMSWLTGAGVTSS